MMLRGCFAFCLAVMLSLTSVTAAVARGQMAGATDVVVCAGAGVVTITLDAAGRPVTVAHHCPVCTAASAASFAGAPPAIMSPLTRSEALAVAVVLPLHGGAMPVAMARGPPVRG